LKGGTNQPNNQEAAKPKRETVLQRVTSFRRALSKKTKGPRRVKLYGKVGKKKLTRGQREKERGKRLSSSVLRKKNGCVSNPTMVRRKRKNRARGGENEGEVRGHEETFHMSWHRGRKDPCKQRLYTRGGRKGRRGNNARTPKGDPIAALKITQRRHRRETIRGGGCC